MIEFEKALNLILENTPGPTGICRVPLIDASGRVLASDVISDVDIPPFNKSAMDGFAVRAEDLEVVPANLNVVMDIRAGTTPSGPIGAGQAASVMTGAPIPEGSDTVVQVEWTSGFGEKTVRIDRSVNTGANVSPRGEIVETGATVLSEGTLIDVEEVALLAAVGCDPVPVFELPSVAILTTGDEIVAPSEKPGPSQIRDTNGPALAAFIRSLGLSSVLLHRAGDDIETLRRAVIEGLEYDCLLMSGGVSAGAYDFVEDVLVELDVTIHTRRIAVKPGKPTVFGTRGDRMIFGLPGNPVSGLVMARLLVETALRIRMGYRNPGIVTVRARLTKDIRKKANRAWYIHGTLSSANEITVTPVANRGSADLPAAQIGNCLIVAPKGETLIERDSTVDVVVWERSW
jgi:molybdopterin molybdotransferase